MSEEEDGLELLIIETALLDCVKACDGSCKAWGKKIRAKKIFEEIKKFIECPVNVIIGHSE